MNYIEISEKINAAIDECLKEEAKVDEIFAALTVVREIWNIRLAQVIVGHASPTPDN